MQPQDVVLLDMPLVTSTPTLLQLGLLLPLFPHHSLTHSTPPGLAVLCSHQALKASTHYFCLVCFFPSPPAIHLPIPHHYVWKCFAHIKHLRHQHITSAWFASSPFHCHLFV